MRILHICLAAFYIEGYAYQENVLPRMHKKMGHEVKILASTETYIDNMKLGYIKPCRYINGDGIEVTRVPYTKWVPQKIAPKIRAYKAVTEYLNTYKPEFVFLHDVQFYNILDVVKYKKKNPQVIVVADGHADYKNSAKSFISKEILHKLYYGFLVRKSEKYISKFYGTLPSRNIFFEEMYGIPKQKTEYLPMGIDDDKLAKCIATLDRKALRKRMGVNEDDILLITGGKINRQKIGIINLISALNRTPKNIKAIVFGSLDSDMKKEYEQVVDKQRVSFLGWLNEDESIKYMLIADIAVFPCLHSTLWEQAAGVGLPCILYKIENFTHINIHNNCIFVDDIDSESLYNAIITAVSSLKALTANALVAKDYFSYKNTAARVISIENN